jgi:hypothetical protein
MKCVECGEAVLHVYREFSKGNIRLTRCSACGAIADKYIEFESILLFLDLLLLKPQVYRHLLFNAQNNKGPVLWRLIPAFLLCDAFLMSRNAPALPASTLILQAALEFAAFVLVAWRLAGWFLGEAFNALIISSFGKLLAVLMMIWDYDPLHETLLLCFVLASNSIAVSLLSSKSFSLIKAFLIIAAARTGQLLFRTWFLPVFEPE